MSSAFRSKCCGLLMFLTCPLLLSSQVDFARYRMLLEDRWTLADLPAEAQDHKPCTPVLKDSIVAPDELEIQFAAWEGMDSLENVVVRWILDDGMKNHQRLGWLSDGFCLPLTEMMSAEGLPPSLGYLPLLLTCADLSYIGPGDRRGMWALSSNEMEAPSCVDNRHLLEPANQLAGRRLIALAKAHPNDPLEVVWRFLRWSDSDAQDPHPNPGENQAFDEWITLYRVIVRLLENLERTSQRGKWLLAWSQWEEVTWHKDMSRRLLRQELGWNRREQQTFLPWWSGPLENCPDATRLVLALPADAAAAWRRSFGEGLPEETWSPSSLHLHEVRTGESLGLIARKYGVTLAEIMSENGMDEPALHAGQTLRIPDLK